VACPQAKWLPGEIYHRARRKSLLSVERLS
jgi:hypothetical protein